MPQIILLEKVLDAAKTPNWFVVVMGIGTVFVGLISIIAICSVMGLFFRGQNKRDPAPVAASAHKKSMENRQEILAAVCAAAAEEMGTDVSALKVISFKKL